MNGNSDVVGYRFHPTDKELVDATKSSIVILSSKLITQVHSHGNYPTTTDKGFWKVTGKGKKGCAEKTTVQEGIFLCKSKKKEDENANTTPSESCQPSQVVEEEITDIRCLCSLEAIVNEECQPMVVSDSMMLGEHAGPKKLRALAMVDELTAVKHNPHGRERMAIYVKQSATAVNLPPKLNPIMESKGKRKTLQNTKLQMHLNSGNLCIVSSQFIMFCSKLCMHSNDKIWFFRRLNLSEDANFLHATFICCIFRIKSGYQLLGLKKKRI
ncbi:hypothetical protein GQ457_08G022180 [Hibiscus cannabinus]